MSLSNSERQFGEKIHDANVVHADPVPGLNREVLSHAQQTFAIADPFRTPVMRLVSTFEEGFAELSREELMEGITSVLVEALGVDDEEVVEGANLQSDLGAESIDFLDIRFRTEKKFGIKVPFDAPFKTVGSILQYLEVRQQDIRQRAEGESGGNSHVRKEIMP